MLLEKKRHLHPPPPPEKCFLSLPQENSGAAGGGIGESPLPIFSPCKSTELAVCCMVLIQYPKPVARAPPSASSRALQQLQQGVGEAPPGAAGRLGAASFPPGAPRHAGIQPRWGGPGGHTSPQPGPASRRGHVVGRLCWESGPGHEKYSGLRNTPAVLAPLQQRVVWVALCGRREHKSAPGTGFSSPPPGFLSCARRLGLIAI